MTRLKKYFNNMSIKCTKKDVLMALAGIIPFIPFWYYGPKLVSKIQINKSGIKYWNPEKEKRVFKAFHNNLEYIGD